ncbi:MAG: hypothetical protein HDT43_00810 [Ruminococcaceae bacterium]|nr:hypothetical protein [Oscillospiraceae bacterium]
MKKTKLRLVKLDGCRKRKWARIRKKDGRIDSIYESFFHVVLGIASPSLTVWYVGTKV